MVAFPSLATAIFAVGFLNLIKAGYSGVLPSVLSEQFPVETRAVGVSFSFSVSVTIFGGFAPFTATWLIAQRGPAAGEAAAPVTAPQCSGRDERFIASPAQNIT